MRYLLNNVILVNIYTDIFCVSVNIYYVCSEQTSNYTEQMYNKRAHIAIAKKDYSFRIAFSRLDLEAKNRVREEICKKLHISISSFNKKKLAYFNITTIEADVIREVFAKEKIKKVFNYEYAD